MGDQGAHAVYLGPSGTQIGHKETMKDTARVLGRMVHGAVIRTFDQQDVVDFTAAMGSGGQRLQYRQL